MVYSKSMKRTLTISIALLGLLVLGGCSKEGPQIVERDGIYYEVDSQTPYSGSSVSYHENGQLEASGNYKDGKMEGLHELYYENGQLEFKGNFKDGEEID